MQELRLLRLGGFITQSDPIGIAGGLNLYGYAGGDPINFSDPFGLCAEGDTILIEVEVDCGDGTTGTRSVEAVELTPGEKQLISLVASRLQGGTAEVTPALITEYYDLLLGSTGGVYKFPTHSADGYPVIWGGATKESDVSAGMVSWIAFRRDAFRNVFGPTVCQWVGHEGTHAVSVADNLGLSEPFVTALNWTCR